MNFSLFICESMKSALSVFIGGSYELFRLRIFNLFLYFRQKGLSLFCYCALRVLSGKVVTFLMLVRLKKVFAVKDKF